MLTPQRVQLMVSPGCRHRTRARELGLPLRGCVAPTRRSASSGISYELPQIIGEVLEFLFESVQLPIGEAVPPKVIVYVLRILRKAEAPEP